MASSTEVEVGMEKVAVSRKRTHDGRCVKAASPLPEVVSPLPEVVSTLPISAFFSSVSQILYRLDQLACTLLSFVTVCEILF